MNMNRLTAILGGVALLLPGLLPAQRRGHAQR